MLNFTVNPVAENVVTVCEQTDPLDVEPELVCVIFGGPKAVVNGIG
jgi:hypothetical protein